MANEDIFWLCSSQHLRRHKSLITCTIVPGTSMAYSLNFNGVPKSLLLQGVDKSVQLLI